MYESIMIFAVSLLIFVWARNRVEEWRVSKITKRIHENFKKIDEMGKLEDVKYQDEEVISAIKALAPEERICSLMSQFPDVVRIALPKDHHAVTKLGRELSLMSEDDFLRMMTSGSIERDPNKSLLRDKYPTLEAAFWNFMAHLKSTDAFEEYVKERLSRSGRIYN